MLMIGVESNNIILMRFRSSDIFTEIHFFESFCKLATENDQSYCRKAQRGKKIVWGGGGRKKIIKNNIIKNEFDSYITKLKYP